MPRHLKDWLSSYEEYVDGTEPPTIFHTWCGISALCAALKRKVYMQLGFNTVYPNMYIVLVAPPAAARKGTAMKEAKSIMREVGFNLAPDSATREGLIKCLMKGGENATTHDDQLFLHSSLTIYNEELIQLFTHHSVELIKALTIWFDCEPSYEYFTAKDESRLIINPWINLIGAMTPTGVASTFPNGDVFGGGLASRMVFIYADKKKQDAPLPELSREKLNLREKLVRDLESISTISGPLLPSQELIDTYSAWYIKSEKKPRFAIPQLQGYNNRRQTHLLKLCLALTASQAHENGRTLEHSTTVTSKIFARALAILEEAEAVMEKTFFGFGDARNANLQANILRAIERMGEVKQSQLTGMFHSDVERPKDLQDIIDLLVSSKKVQRISGNFDDTLKWNPISLNGKHDG